MHPGAFLEKYRLDHGLTKTQLAQLLDYNQGNMVRLLNHKQRHVLAQTACHFARKLGVSVEVLMGMETPKSDKKPVEKKSR